jgi:hypothetical protein
MTDESGDRKERAGVLTRHLRTGFSRAVTSIWVFDSGVNQSGIFIDGTTLTYDIILYICIWKTTPQQDRHIC